jgi:surface protein
LSAENPEDYFIMKLRNFAHICILKKKHQASDPEPNFKVFLDDVEKSDNNGEYNIWLNKEKTFTVKITGDFYGLKLKSMGYDTGNEHIEIIQWGSSKWYDFSDLFKFSPGGIKMPVEPMNISKISSISGMFRNCDFNKIENLNISSWDVSRFKDFSYLFENAKNFNQDISLWDVSNATDMSYMFSGCSSFNCDISQWKTDKLENARAMFLSASSFNQNINTNGGFWDVSNLRNAKSMFANANSFNQALDKWDTSSISDFSFMFRNATKFNQDLSTWDISSASQMNGFLNNTSSFSSDNYNKLLIEWAKIDNLNQGIKFTCNSKFTSELALNARTRLINDHSWEIIDYGYLSDLENQFILIYKTIIENENINIPLISNKNYKFYLSADDADTPLQLIEKISDEEGINLNFQKPGFHAIKISYTNPSTSIKLTDGSFPGLRHGFDNSLEEDKKQEKLNNSKKLVTILNWGDEIIWETMFQAFQNCSNLSIKASDYPILGNNINAESCFEKATQLSTGLSNWDVSNIVNMTSMFKNAINFNDNLSNWDVQNILNFDSCFETARMFNSDISEWIINANSTKAMFKNASSFNSATTKWNCSNVSDFSAMFESALSFNQELRFSFNNANDLTNFLLGANSFTSENYSILLEELDKTTVSNKTIHISSKYKDSDIPKRNSLLSNGWIIYDYGNINEFRPLIIKYYTNSNYRKISFKLNPYFSYNYNYELYDESNKLLSSGNNITSSQSEYSLGSTNGYFTLKITGGDFPATFINDGYGIIYPVEIVSWGDIKLKSLESAFAGSKGDENGKILFPESETPNFDNLISTKSMFANSSFTSHPSLEKWDMSNVRNMSNMFQSASEFNQDISFWDVSSVTDMSSMFYQAYKFNSDINLWNTKNLENMNAMFQSAKIFNSELYNWNTSKVKNMVSCFSNTLFNKNINSWDVSNVSDMSYMFSGSQFCQHLGSWDMSNVKNITGMFSQLTAIDPSISTWDLSNLEVMNTLFAGSSNVNIDLSNWNVSKVKSMSDLFKASDFKGDISSWDFSSIDNINYTNPMRDILNLNVSTTYPTDFYVNLISNWYDKLFIKYLDLGAISSCYSKLEDEQKLVNLQIQRKWTISDKGRCSSNEFGSDFKKYIKLASDNKFYYDDFPFSSNYTHAYNFIIIESIPSDGHLYLDMNYNKNCEYGERLKEGDKIYMHSDEGDNFMYSISEMPTNELQFKYRIVDFSGYISEIYNCNLEIIEQTNKRLKIEYLDKDLNPIETNILTINEADTDNNSFITGIRFKIDESLLGIKIPIKINIENKNNANWIIFKEKIGDNFADYSEIILDETQSEYILSIQANHDNQNTGDKSINFNIICPFVSNIEGQDSFTTNIIEDDSNPSISNLVSKLSFIYSANSSTKIYTFNATDADTEIKDLHWSINNDAFSINNIGELYTIPKNINPEKENYNIVVSVSDGINNTDYPILVNQAKSDSPLGIAPNQSFIYREENTSKILGNIRLIDGASYEFIDSYTITDDSDNIFELKDNLQLRIKETADIDFSKDKTYNITIKITDKRNPSLEYNETVSIEVKKTNLGIELTNNLLIEITESDELVTNQELCDFSIEHSDDFTIINTIFTIHDIAGFYSYSDYIKFENNKLIQTKGFDCEKSQTHIIKADIELELQNKNSLEKITTTINDYSFVLKIIDINDNKPQILGASNIKTINSSSAIGDILANPQAIDDDRSSSFSNLTDWTIENPLSETEIHSLFEINNSTGEIKLKQLTHKNEIYNILISVSDGTHKSDNYNLAIHSMTGISNQESISFTKNLLYNTDESSQEFLDIELGDFNISLPDKYTIENVNLDFLTEEVSFNYSEYFEYKNGKLYLKKGFDCEEKNSHFIKLNIQVDAKNTENNELKTFTENDYSFTLKLNDINDNKPEIIGVKNLSPISKTNINGDIVAIMQAIDNDTNTENSSISNWRIESILSDPEVPSLLAIDQNTGEIKINDINTNVNRPILNLVITASDGTYRSENYTLSISILTQEELEIDLPENLEYNIDEMQADNLSIVVGTLSLDAPTNFTIESINMIIKDNIHSYKYSDYLNWDGSNIILTKGFDCEENQTHIINSALQIKLRHNTTNEIHNYLKQDFSFRLIINDINDNKPKITGIKELHAISPESITGEIIAKLNATDDDISSENNSLKDWRIENSESYILDLLNINSTTGNISIRNINHDLGSENIKLNVSVSDGSFRSESYEFIVPISAESGLNMVKNQEYSIDECNKENPETIIGEFEILEIPNYNIEEIRLTIKDQENICEYSKHIKYEDGNLILIKGFDCEDMQDHNIFIDISVTASDKLTKKLKIFSKKDYPISLHINDINDNYPEIIGIKDLRAISKNILNNDIIVKLIGIDRDIEPENHSLQNWQIEKIDEKYKELLIIDQNTGEISLSKENAYIPEEIITVELSVSDGRLRSKNYKLEIPIINDSQDTSFELYPNPSHGQINIRYAGKMNGKLYIKLMSSSGSIAYQGTHNSREINLNLDLKKGIYVLSIDNGENEIHKTVMIL